MVKNNLKQEVRQFYDEIGWQQISDGVYQNAKYEDLRPVSRKYIHNCHLRITRHLETDGKFLLDAGSGPIQYPEYLSYSKGYQFRVCLDISIVALKDARVRIGMHGLFVVGDIARLPFKDDVFDGIVSLHTIHHLPQKDYVPAFSEIKRVLRNGCTAVVVNGWEESSLMSIFHFPVLFMEKIFGKEQKGDNGSSGKKANQPAKPKGTYVNKLNAGNLRKMLGEDFPVEINVWRSVSVRFMRAMIHPWLLGQFWLEILYGLEEAFPRFFGKNGQYPLVIFRK